LAVKNLAKRLLQRIGENSLANVDLYRQSSINSLIISKMKLNKAIPNIDEHNKTNSIFFRVCLVPRAIIVLFDDGEVHCRVYDSWLSRIYKQTIA